MSEQAVLLTRDGTRMLPGSLHSRARLEGSGELESSSPSHPPALSGLAPSVHGAGARTRTGDGDGDDDDDGDSLARRTGPQARPDDSLPALTTRAGGESGLEGVSTGLDTPPRDARRRMGGRSCSARLHTAHPGRSLARFIYVILTSVCSPPASFIYAVLSVCSLPASFLYVVLSVCSPPASSIYVGLTSSSPPASFIYVVLASSLAACQRPRPTSHPRSSIWFAATPLALSPPGQAHTAVICTHGSGLLLFYVSPRSIRLEKQIPSERKGGGVLDPTASRRLLCCGCCSPRWRLPSAARHDTTSPPRARGPRSRTHLTSARHSVQHGAKTRRACLDTLARTSSLDDRIVRLLSRKRAAPSASVVRRSTLVIIHGTRSRDRPSRLPTSTSPALAPPIPRTDDLKDTKTTGSRAVTVIMPPADLKIHTDLAPRPRRSQSASSDRPSLGSYGGLLSPPTTVSPDPAFIAASAASQIVIKGHESHADSGFERYGLEPPGDTAQIAPAALGLINRFLDSVLFNFLSAARSTSLALLRPAVVEVLKPKLAREAIAGADQELHEYLGDGAEAAEEELAAIPAGSEADGGLDLELVWRRTRLRCMAYSSLGDMEEGDEDLYMGRDAAKDPPGAATSRNPDRAEVVSPEVAIFLTSILEFVGEQVLAVAGQAAYHRLRVKIEHAEKDGSATPADTAERVVVEDTDMEKVALDRTLGRLWRGWKKRIRTPTTSVSTARSFSRESLRLHSRAGSFATEEVIDEVPREPSAPVTLAGDDFSFSRPPRRRRASRAGSVAPEEVVGEGSREAPGVATLAEHEAAALVPLPLSDHDVREIEVPGLARQSDDDESSPSEDEVARLPPRPRSTMHSPRASDRPAASSPSPDRPGRAAWGSRKRAYSLPAAPPLPFRSAKRQKPSVRAAAAGIPAAGPRVTEDGSASDGPRGVRAGLVPGAADPGDFEGEEEFTEEAQIMTSARVSICGGVLPDEIVGALARRSSDRSPSVHSLRLIELTRSRNGSTDVSDHVVARPIVVSRPGSMYSPVFLEAATPRLGSPVSRAPTVSPITRNGSLSSKRRTRSIASDMISEVDEKQLAGGRPAMRSPAKDTRGHENDTISPPHLMPTAGSKPAAGTGVPPLTPLRDMVEGARDTSDEYSSIAQSTDAQSLTDQVPGEPSPSASTSTIPYYRPAPVEARASSREAPGSRTFSPRAGAPESTAKSQRPIHTSGSWSSVSSHKVRAVRTSDESVSRSIEQKGQSFEDLIRSDQTIQYTLTSQNMRDIEASPDSPRYTAPPGPPGERLPTHRSNSSSLASLPKGTGLKSSPQSPQSLRLFEPSSRAPFSSTVSRLRPSAPQARDARVDRDSMSDFAEFIRSTGESLPPRLGPANSYENAPARAPAPNRGAPGAPRNFSVSGSPRVAPAALVPQRASSAAGRPKLQARDAAVPRGETVSDLIDFVRCGPQLEKQDHRIPRTVAPFRRTMDSDQLAGATGGRAVDASLPDLSFGQATFADGPDLRLSQRTSVTSSVNSQSGLLGGARKPPTPKSPGNAEEPDVMPRRKTRRIRDPYALDDSGDEDDERPSTRPRPIKEESLADFLRNAPPPPEPVFEPASQPAPSKVKKKPSSASLIARFGRSGSTPGLPGAPKPLSQLTGSPKARKAPLHIPIAATYSTTTSHEQARQPNSASQLDAARSTSSKVSQKGYQPREAVHTARSQTSDLADFLLSSEPPPSSGQASPRPFSPLLQREESSAFQRIFGRKKAH
ncbi:hypothetical protein B2J93_3150 [Marssonina coronariae]|uniref:Uncharacterized protein n=1 Tax=Diplocarpon coronariae TaxID=2795749 RepID=A0A218Z3M6_9HELO|nr:hypothetical protein B2J93_3150 [Marssonina coronariae]